MTAQDATEQLLPRRHLVLLGEVWDMCIEGDSFTPRDLPYVLRAMHNSSLRDWIIVRRDDGTLDCPELEADLDYLHRRGFIFKTANPSIVPTASAEFALKAAKMLE